MFNGKSMNPFQSTKKLFRYVDRLAELKNHGRVACPVSVEIAPTNRCDAKCPWCFYDRTKEEIEPHVLLAAITEMAQFGVLGIAWTGGGEPTLHPAFEEGVKVARSYGMHQGLFTNGRRSVEDPRAFEWIRVSITEHYDLPDTISDYVGETTVGVCFNLTATNLDELPLLAEQADRMGVDYFQIRPALSRKLEDQKVVPSVDHVLDVVSSAAPRLRVIAAEYKWTDYLLPHHYPNCYGHTLAPFLWYDGTLGPCGYRKDYVFADLNKQTFPDAWYGMRHFPVTPDCQHCCKLHEVNKSLAVMMGDVEVEHPVFL
jgi:MoaA/NifB/PqqE/SkfB family radical SAM enzyme